jgi:spore maturation protein B
MEAVTDYIVPLILFSIAAFAIGKGENAYDIMLQGASQGLRLLVSIVPSLILLLTAVHMLRASGAMDLLSNFLSPAFSLFGIPPETAMLVLIRPISGSAALAVGAELMAEYGVDSHIGRTVAVMLGSTETTFYTISVYFGAAGIQKTRYTVPAALFADFVGFFMASWTVRLLYA